MTSDNSLPSEIVSAEWSRALGSADSARARAQSGFSVASAIAAALVAAGLFTNLSDRAHPARWVGAGALALWLLAMLAFLVAVATGTEPDVAQAAATMNEWADVRLLSVREERARVERRLRLAVGVTIAALAVTAATLVVGLVGWGTDQDRGLLLLTKSGVSAVERICTSAHAREASGSVSFVSPIHGTLDVPTLKSDFVIFHIDRGGCRATRPTPVRIARDDVLSFSEDSSS